MIDRRPSERWSARLRRWLLTARSPWALAVLAVLMSLPALWMGLGSDDHLHRSMLRHTPPMPPIGNPLWDLFRFFPDIPGSTEALRAQGLVGWWTDPDMRGVFLRPLTALTHVLDERLIPEAIGAQHLHSLLWYGLAVVACCWALRQGTRSRAIAGLAGWMFAIEEAHAMPAGWLANRNAVIALLFGALAVALHLRGQRRRSWSSVLLGALALALGLAAGETALGAVGYLVAAAMFLDDAPWRRRLAALAPAGVVLVAWALAWCWTGSGLHGSGLYVDPTSEPLRFAGAVLLRAPVLLLSLWLQVSCDLWLVFPAWAHALLALAGWALAAALAWLFRPLLAARAEARFWALGMALALVPVCGAFPMDRLTLFAGLGAFGLLAAQVAEMGIPKGGAVPAGSRRAQLTMVLLVLHAVVPLAYKPAHVSLLPLTFGPFRRAEAAVPADPSVLDATVVFVNGFDIVNTMWPASRAGTDRAMPQRVVLLASLLDDLVVRRIDARTLELRPAHGFLAHIADQLTRGPRPFVHGERIRTADFTAEVRELTDDARPARVRFTFRAPLEDPSWRWMFYEGGRPRAWRLPAVGEARRIARTLPMP